MDSLVALFSKLIAYVLLWEQQCHAAGAQRSYEQVRRDMAALLQEQEATAAHQTLAVQHFLAARLAVIAWIDEVVLRQKIVLYHDRWQASPLQAEYYGTSTAEAEQQTALQQLFSSEPAVRDVYTLCLSLGFSGRRGSSLTDRLLLADLHSLPGQDAPLQAEHVWTPGFRLTSQPYATSAPAVRLWPLPLALVGTLLGAGLLLGLWTVWRATPPWVPLPQEVPLSQGVPPPPVCVPSPTLVPTIQQRLVEQSCSRLAVQVQECAVTLSGRIAQEEQRTALRGFVQGLPGVNSLEDASLRVVPRPFCDVLELFEPLNEPAAHQAGALSVRPNKAGQPPLYTAGEDLTLEVTTPALFASYLYVDFYGNDGQIWYLYSNQVLGEPFAPGSSHTLGLLDGKPVWGIGPPYGSGLLTVIASKTPLMFPPPAAHDTPESAVGYLSRLRQALPQESAQTMVEAAFVFIETQAQ